MKDASDHSSGIRDELPHGKRGRLLVVEDDVDAARLLARTLSRDWEVALAIDGAAGLETALRAPHPDVILTDISMPGVDGIEMVRRIRRAMPELRIPIIFMTARSGASVTAAAIAAGARYFITKPVSLPGLEQKLRLALQRPSMPPSRAAL